MTDPLLGILKIALLALLYLFFARVMWAVWSEVRSSGPSRRAPSGTPHAGISTAPPGTTGATSPPSPTSPSSVGPAGVPPAASEPAHPARGRRSVTRLVVIEPRARKGMAFPVPHELTIGRAAACSVSLTEDTFVSQLHARVYRDDDQVLVEDLGSTNGTYHNSQRVSAPSMLKRGDRLQVGSTVLEVG